MGIVLLSGGMDSMACLHRHRSAGAKVRGLFVDYGQAAAAREAVAAGHVAEHFDVPLTVVRVDGLAPLISGKGFVLGRNMAFVLLALMNVTDEERFISLGIHSGTGYSDCSPEFVDLAQKVCNLYTGGRVRIEAPFVTDDKVDVAIYCLKNQLPRHLSYSCELGLDQPCGRCASCKDLIALDG